MRQLIIIGTLLTILLSCDDKLTYENNGLTIWTSYSKNGLNDNYAWFDLRSGNVTVKNPDEEIRNKMIDIARQLNAKVQGDDGETYDTKVLATGKTGTKGERPWWKFWS